MLLLLLSMEAEKKFLERHAILVKPDLEVPIVPPVKLDSGAGCIRISGRVGGCRLHLREGIGRSSKGRRRLHRVLSKAFAWQAEASLKFAKRRVRRRAAGGEGALVDGQGGHKAPGPERRRQIRSCARSRVRSRSGLLAGEDGIELALEGWASGHAQRGQAVR